MAPKKGGWVSTPWVFGIFLLIFIDFPEISTLKLTVLHTNDVHCRFLSFNSQNRVCDEDDVKNGECWGGAARRMTLIDRIRREEKNVILLDGGDQFQGTVWFTVFGFKPIVEYMNIMNYQAMAFGNHEFDNRLEGLVPFVKNSTVPFVNSNIDSKGSILEGTYQTSLEYNVEGETIAIIGYTSTQTPDISKPGDQIKFNDEIESLKLVVQSLKDKGINKIVALGHSGITTDRNICKKVAGVDVVVGGHTNTFLYSGTPPSKEHPEGPYPEVYTQTGENCLVVQDYAYGKYLGFLQLDFDDQGVIRNWTGNPILINTSISEDPRIHDILEPYAKRLEEVEKTVVGVTGVPLNSTGLTCKRQECVLGDMISDAFLYHYLKHQWDTDKTSAKNTSATQNWAPSAVAIMNSGGIREFYIDGGQQLTLGDLHTIMPFSDTVQMVRLAGRHIREALEHSVWDFYEDDTHGKFLQMSGIKVIYDLSKPNGRRVISVLIRCADCATPAYQSLSDDKEYNVVTNSYVVEGGNGYYVIKNNILQSDYSDALDIEVMSDYIEKFQPIIGEIEGRISFVTDDNYKEVVRQSSKGRVLKVSYCTIISVFVTLWCVRK